MSFFKATGPGMGCELLRACELDSGLMPPSCDPFLRFEKQLVEEQAKASCGYFYSSWDVPSVVGCRIWEVVFDDPKVPLLLSCFLNIFSALCSCTSTVPVICINFALLLYHPPSVIMFPLPTNPLQRYMIVATSTFPPMGCCRWPRLRSNWRPRRSCYSKDV